MERRQSEWLCQVLCLQVNIINRMKNKVKIIAGIGGEQSWKRTEKRKTGWENKRKENQPGNM